MSYDLYFINPRVSLETFSSHFAKDKKYQLSGREAIYHNQDTGVYFIFTYSTSKTDNAEENASFATFTMNYYRPHYFGLEAVPEVTRFVEAFQCSILDTQMHGMDEGPYSAEGFLRGWNYGNEFCYSAVLTGPEPPPPEVWSMPTDRLQAIWEWNYRKEEYQAPITEDAFVPRINFMVLDNQIASAAIWPDAISELIPEVDILLVGRERLAPRRFLRGLQKEVCILPFDEARAILEPYRTSDYSINAFRLPSPITPTELHDFVRSLRLSAIELRLVSPDQVLNSEIIAKVTAERS